MVVRLDEKRRSTRVSAAYPVRIHDVHGNLLARGRTANISENGLFAVVEHRVHLPQEVMIEMTLPSAASAPGRRGVTRTVVYRARVVRRQVLGNLLAVGVELLRKVE